MEYTKFSGKTVNDAIIDACQKLEVKYFVFIRAD